MSVAEQYQETEDSFYAVEDPTDQIWWNGVKGENSIETVKEVLNAAGVEAVHEKQEELIDPEYAFEAEELENIRQEVEELYSGRYEWFVEEASVSDLHPQQTKQLERYFENLNLETVPERFDTYDGFPLPE
ncbi:MAG: hypothetical protein ABEK00_01830 [Candidatus Nanohaloarchaea archaeon]